MRELLERARLVVRRQPLHPDERVYPDDRRVYLAEQIDSHPGNAMNDARFCSIHLDTRLTGDAMATLVAELTDGAVAQRGVDVAWGRLAVDGDYGDFAKRADPDDFLGWPVLLEVMPAAGTRPDDVVPAVAGLMMALIGHGLRVLAQSDYAEQPPGGGEIAPAPATR